ncbi:hypothetical protein [Alicyclobacillus fodiniaquatilis]|jgi:hypothetical protein|uniref:Uncharacterized protein n=1 Tax=Alicyclobacillus fodiniaquatilis TaxID=1661150 RepID=A0ABW4JFZ6_9BACL
MDELRDGSSFSLPFARSGGDQLQLQRAHERYDVYVNQQYVGHKTLLKQAESADDIKAFLERANIDGFTTELNGFQDELHYKITADDDNTVRAIRNQLTTYLDTHATGVTGDQPGF